MISATDFFARLAVLAVALCAAVLPAAAQTDMLGAPLRSIFTVSNVAVDVTGASAAAARQSAIAQSRRLAFSRIYQKLVAEEDWSLEPALTNKGLTDLVRAIDVTDERTSATRYLAALSVSFDDEKLTQLFQRLGVTFTDSDTPPISLVPLVTYGGQRMLTSPDNVWLLAWQRSPIRAASLVNYVLPEASAAYRRHISPAAAAEATPQALIDLIAAQDARDVLIAQADIRLDLSSRLYVASFDVRRGPGQAPFMAFGLLQQSDESPQDMLERAIAAIDGELSALWKRQLLAEFSQARTVAIEAEYDKAEEWSAIRRGLAGTRRLRNLRFETVSLSAAQATARFFGSFSALEQTFAASRLQLSEERYGLWRIRPMSDAEWTAYAAQRGSENLDFVDPLEAQADALIDESEDPLTDMDVPPWELNQEAAQDTLLEGTGSEGEN